ncbi:MULTISPECIES: hypothetical protein [Pseudomonas]|uniref:hypothetical protein n=1 Tax=Pseudomonas TaxID=286 RepID=UPI001E419CAC|nr:MULTISPECIES: hypothetical protein [Pseudomonas]MCE1117319.1 hypothetical protein [Pseudomonas sp. NMI795_08]
MESALGLVVVLFFAWVIWLYHLKLSQQARRRREVLYEAFEATMKEHRVKSFEILMERIKIREKFHSDELYRILLIDPGSYFLYYDGRSGSIMFLPISKARAMLAMEGKASIRA